MSNSRPLHVSSLKRIYQNSRTNLPQLSMAEITDFDVLPDFQALRDHVLEVLRYPQPQQDKLESYGWVPAMYDFTARTFKNRETGLPFTREGSWRVGRAEFDALSVFYADVDNNDPTQPLVSMAEVAAKLTEHGLAPNHFLYTSYSHTPEKPKFRVVMEIDRDITRAEMLRMFIWMNWAILGGQGDPSIYDAGDFIFAPPHHTETREFMSGAPLAVDDILVREGVLRQTEPTCWTGYLTQQEPRESPQKRTLSAEEQQQLAARIADMSVRPEVTIQNSVIFNPAWDGLYAAKVEGGSHWQTMRSLMCMVWAKSGGSLTWGEMERLFHEVDATAANYFLATHGADKMTALLTWVMSLPVEAKEPDLTLILDREESGLVIDSVEAECGEGKTHFILQHMAHERRRYVYIVDKIENIEKRRQEFFALAGRNIATRFLIREAHSRSDESLRVPHQLQKIREEVNRLSPKSAVVVFVTQQGAVQMDWSRWTDFEAIIDEVPEVFATFKLKAREHAGVLRQYIQAAGQDGNCYGLELTERGWDAARTTDVDDYNAVHHGLLVMLAKPNTGVWVKASGWDNPADGILEFFAVTSPLNFRPFRRVWMLGDELTKSSTAQIWQSNWNVTFRPVEFDRRKRAVSTASRTSIRYFSDHRDSSLTRFGEGDMPLTAITDFIAGDATGKPVLWTVNERHMSKCTLPTNDYISPKSHGRNDLTQFTHVAWLAAMKPSKFEVGSLKQICGMTAQELIDWREFNTLYQFVLRGTLRDFDSTTPAVIYVFSVKQAEYLHRRLGGTVQKIDGVVIDQPVRCLHPDGAMTAAERQKARFWRCKMRTAGVTDVQLLPKADKLTEREVYLINQTLIASRATNDNSGALAA